MPPDVPKQRVTPTGGEPCCPCSRMVMPQPDQSRRRRNSGYFSQCCVHCKSNKGHSNSCTIFKQFTYTSCRKLIIGEDNAMAAFMVVENQGNIYNYHHTNANYMIWASDLFACKEQEYPTLLNIVLFS